MLKLQLLIFIFFCTSQLSQAGEDLEGRLKIIGDQEPNRGITVTIEANPHGEKFHAKLEREKNQLLNPRKVNLTLMFENMARHESKPLTLPDSMSDEQKESISKLLSFVS